MASATSMLKAYDGMSNMLPQVIQQTERTVTVWNASEQAMNRSALAMQAFVKAIQQVISSEMQAHREIMLATKAQREFNQAADESARKSNKFVQAWKDIDLKKVAATGKSFLGRILSDGAEQQTALDQISLRAGGPAAGQQIFDRTAAQALKYGQNVNAALTGTQQFMAKTTDPAQLEKLNLLAIRLSQLNPGKGLGGAAGALSQMLSGDTKALSSDYQIPAAALDNGAVQAAVKQGDVSGMIAAMDGLLNKRQMTQAALESMMDSPAVKWKRAVDTLNFQLGSIGRQGLNALGPMFDAMLEVFNSDAFKNFISGLGAGLSIVGTFASDLVQGAASFFETLTANGSSTNMILLGIGAGLALMGVLLWSMVAPIVAQGIAWLAAYWPVLLIIAVIGILVAVLMKFGVSAQEIVGFVVGLFYGLFAYLHNQVALLYNLLISFVEFLLNLFIDPVYAIQKLIYDLAMTFGGYMYNMLRSAEDFAGGFMSVILEAINGALKGINKLIEGFNNLFGTNVKQMELFDETNIHALSDKIKNKLDSLKPPDKPENAFELGRMDYKNLAGAYNRGNAIGAKAFDKMANTLNSVKSGFEKTPGENMTSAAGQGANVANIGSVGNVGSVDRINETVDISSEDLKMMRELAEVTAIQNFTTLTPTVTVNTGPVAKEADIHSIVTQIEQMLEEEIATSAAGVYA
ncbi:hypothetical protein [Paenibacillus phocaensis]|uniref:hypothetical protein n=1 Tax=Paenibacillus phocaensis TaxID=1776378 RepID=UPI000AF19AA6|nr:hypothetical protein [Paenibacillus phocaensis]